MKIRRSLKQDLRPQRTCKEFIAMMMDSRSEAGKGGEGGGGKVRRSRVERVEVGMGLDEQSNNPTLHGLGTNHPKTLFYVCVYVGM